MSVKAQYLQKRVAAAEVIRLLRDDDVIVVPTGVGEPPALLAALSEQRRSLRNVCVAQTLPLRKFGYFDPETREHVRHLSYFFSATSRPGGTAGGAAGGAVRVDLNQADEAALRRQVAVLSKTLGPRHPSLTSVLTEADALAKAIRSETERLRRENQTLRARFGQDDELTGTSASINGVRATIKKVAGTGSAGK